jgi:hypothetical protein
VSSDKFTNPIVQSVNTEYDYVFVNRSDCEDFKFLTVIGHESDKDASLKIKVSLQAELTFLDDYHAVFDLTFFNGTHTGDNSKKVEIEMAHLKDGFGVEHEFTEFTTVDFKWYYNGEEMVGEDEATLVLTFDMFANPLPSYFAGGRHVFTAVAIIDGIPYSRNFTLDIRYGKDPLL